MCHPGLSPDVRAAATTGPREQQADGAGDRDAVPAATEAEPALTTAP
jgi:hypothetical protein